MRRIYTFILLIFIGKIAFAQSDNNWIQNDQFYYKIGVAENSIHRLTISTLSSAGVPVSSFSPGNVQIFYKGKQIPIEISQNEGVINYIEFFGEKNTGWFDTDLYRAPENQTNPYYSQITDTSAYFLTWSSSENNKRYISTNFVFGTIENPIIGRSIIVNNYTGENQIGVGFPEYGPVKGWFDNQQIRLGNSISKTILLPEVATNGEEANFEIAVVGIGDASSSGDNHHLQIELPDGQLFDTTFSGRIAIKKEFSVPSNLLSETNTIVFRSIDDLNVSADNMAISYVKINYPRNFSLNNVETANFKLEKNTSDQLITLEGIPESITPVIFDTANYWKPQPIFNGNNWQFTLPPSENDHYLIIQKNKIYPKYIRLTDTQLPELSSTTFLIITHPSLQTGANLYANYRNGLVVTTDKLYNHFAYGIEKHPLAIRNFLKYYYNQVGELPECVFLLGKSVGIEYSRKNSTNFSANLVPSMGYPSSDNLMVSKIINSTTYNLDLVVSRLSVQNNEQISQYLSKVQEYSNQQPNVWMKNFIHFGGGVNSTEQANFASYLKNYQQIIEDSLMGARVSTFLKNSSDPIQITASDSIRDLINNGTSMLTFFGHGYSGGFDQDIDEPGAYNNQGKYPLMLANSCYSGNIYGSTNTSASEKWVLIPNKGAIAFLASVAQGYPTYLNDYSEELYRNLAYKNYGKGIGKIIKETTNHHLETSTALLDIGTALNFTLHGDPMIKINQFEKPDILIDNQLVRILPQYISTAIDSFAIVITPINIGKTISQTIYYQIEQLLPNGTDTTYQLTSNGLYYSDTLTAWIPINRQYGTGLNVFNIKADYLNMYNELNELNNQVEISVNIKSTKIFPVYPYPYSKNNKDTIILRASTGNPFIEKVKARFEIDTTANFNSPYLMTFENNFAGGVVEWNTGVQSINEQTYYWRIGSENEEGEMEFLHTSFTTQNNHSGWIQQTINQIAENKLQFIEKENNTFKFQDSPKEVFVKNIGNPNSSEYNEIYYRINNIRTKGACGYVGHIVIGIIDSTDFSTWSSNRDDYGHYNFPKCSDHTFPRANFLFTTNEAALDNMINLVNYIVPDGHYIVMYSWLNGGFESWKNRHFEAFENLGASIIRAVPNEYPYILIAQKGNPNFANEKVGENENATITLSVNLKNNFNYGSITTNWIGPSAEWKTAQWNYKNGIIESNDSVHIDIISKNSTKDKENILYGSIAASATPFDLSNIDANEHPYLKMRFYMRDETNRSPAYPHKISIDYSPISDIAISPSNTFDFPKDSIQQGDILELKLALRNVSDILSSDKQINYSITDLQNNVLAEKTTVISALEENNFDIDTIIFNTSDLHGYYSLWINFSENSNEDFFTFNNLGSIPFYVYPDETNPLLDVTFNGQKIMNGDIVSAKPTINISLTDENPYMELTDTSLFSIYLKKTNETNEHRIYIGPGIEKGTIIWKPAESKTKATIIYMPEFTENGIYELRVQARDPSNNLSGENDYQIQFEVVTETTITQFFNYPNPFSTSTRFVFVLTGSHIPDHISIDIYTVSGKMVKRIEGTQLGAIHIGRNITEYAWNGTDKFGDKLANGVYLYKVNVYMNGKKVELRSTEADGFFKNGWGKMYLMK